MGYGLGVGGQPGRAARIPRLGRCGGQGRERSRLGAGIGDAAGEGLSAIQVTCLGDCGDQFGERSLLRRGGW